MRDTIDMAREAGIYKDCDWRYGMKAEGDSLKAFEVLVRADEQKKWQEQTAVEIHEAVLDEREACAKVCEELVPDMSRTANDASVWDVATFDCATAIRNRGQA
jgi:hypothetical protein